MSRLTDAGIRKIATFIEDSHIEGGKVAGPPLRMVAVAAVLANPWAGKGFVEDLKPEIHRIAPVLGDGETKMAVPCAFWTRPVFNSTVVMVVLVSTGSLWSK